MYTAKPTPKQLEWQDMELGVIIHYLMESYESIFNIDSENIEERVPAAKIDPPKLDPEQWVRSAWELGAKYAVFVAKHGSGFAAWNTAESGYGCRQMAWKNGEGDIFREFVDACKKYGIKPGVYYHPALNKYYKIDNFTKYDYTGEMYQEYVSHVMAQLTELCSQYGEMVEVWFDGGCRVLEQAGVDVGAFMQKYQPDAIAFGGPRSHTNYIRWIENESGLAPENCWATTSFGEKRHDGTVVKEEKGAGDPDGIFYCPAEADMPNRLNYAAKGGGWVWEQGEDDLLYTPEELLDCYIRSVGRNTNLLLGMAISADGDFKEEEQFRAFGKLLRATFGTPLTAVSTPTPSDTNSFSLTVPEGKHAAYLVIRENITEGQLIRGFRVLADGEEIYSSECVGHKRIVPLGENNYKEITFCVTECVENWSLRDAALY